MNRLLALLLCLWLTPTYAAITDVADSNADAPSNTTRTPGEPAGTAQDDLVLAFCSILSTDGAWTDPADFTEITQQVASGGDAAEFYVGYKVRGADAGSGYAFSYSGSANHISCTLQTFRGVDTSTPLDVTYVTGSHYDFNLNSGTAAAAAITTTTDNAAVVLLQWYSIGGSDTLVAPTNYTLVAGYSVAYKNHSVAFRLIASAGTETPGAWGHTGLAGTEDGSNFTIALKAAASAPVFTVGPTEAPAADGYTISGTITGGGTLTVEAVACNPGDTAPTANEIEAGQCGGGNAALMNASEVWTTGVSNDFTLTSANKPPRMDVYVSGTNGTDDTAVTSLTDQDRSARSGFALVAMTSHSTTGLCNLDSYFDPDCADGDVFEYEDDTNEDADCNVSIETDGDVVLTPVGAGDCDGKRTFNASYQDVSSATTGLFTAPTVGNFTTDDLVCVNNNAPVAAEAVGAPTVWTEDAAITALDLTAFFTDADGDSLTFTLTTGTWPTGVAQSGTGNKDVTGTPTTENEAGVALVVTATDECGDSATFSFYDDATEDVYVVNTWTLPNLVNMNVGEAATEILTAAPWREADIGLSVSSFICDPVTVTGDIYSHLPVATSELTAFESVTAVIDRACIGSVGRQIGNRLGFGH